LSPKQRGADEGASASAEGSNELKSCLGNDLVEVLMGLASSASSASIRIARAKGQRGRVGPGARRYRAQAATGRRSEALGVTRQFRGVVTAGDLRPQMACVRALAGVGVM